MHSFIIYNVKYFLTDAYFIIFLGLVLFNLFAVAAWQIQPPDFAVFLMVYLLSVYVERDIGQPMPSLLAVRGRLAVAASVYVSTSLALAAAAWYTPLVLLAPLLAALRRRLDLFLPGVAALAVLSPGSATAVAVFEVLARSRPVATMGRGDLKISTLHPALKALLAASFLFAYLALSGVPNVEIRGLATMALHNTGLLAATHLLAVSVFLAASYGVALGAALDTYLDSYLRVYHFLRRRLSAKPLLTLAWLLAVTSPVCLFATCDGLSHVTLLVLLTDLLWSFKFNLFKNEDAVLLLVGLFVIGYLYRLPWALAAAALLPALPWLAERIRHLLSTSQ
jgi:hypothetical protein